ncbi:MAG: ribonuclease T [Novosphingobium sp.]
MTRRLPGLARLGPALLAMSLPAPALAQAYQCSLPDRIQYPAPPRPDGPVRRTPVSHYLLAVSWSPEFCRSGRDDENMQCSGRNGRFGFVLHGLWPESGRSYPQWCALTPRPSARLLRQNLCMTPSARLLEHEWAKHGSCMTRTPEAYFRTAAILWNSLRWPDADRLSRRKQLTAGDLRREFVLANPDWKRDQVGLVVSRTGWLRELRLCYGRDFMPRACDRRSLGPPDSAALQIWRGL